MIVYLVWAEKLNSYIDEIYLEEIFSTREKAEKYIDSIEESDKIDYNYSIEKREIC